MLRSILRYITWYHGQTLGTRLFTWRKGVKVGEDGLGNEYYETRDGKRRWVCYHDVPEATQVPAEWHGWLHFTWDEPPTKAPVIHKEWEKPHQENMTGSARAYAPAGSMRQSSPAEHENYTAWQPE
jgi:NADH:ubiquinone oxidoreductase subunit